MFQRLLLFLFGLFSGPPNGISLDIVHTHVELILSNTKIHRTPQIWRNSPGLHFDPKNALPCRVKMYMREMQ